MFIDKYRETVHTSTLRIPERLKAIDKGYFVVRNHKTCQWEVHHSGQLDNTLALNIPYEELDERTIKLVKSTRIEYAQNVFNEMERNNKKIEEDAKKQFDDGCEVIAKDIHKYCTAHESKETIDSDYYMKVGEKN